uniref:Uncharacterized protein n=1 Tax=Palpitomonas bilix TaxID=652834 RepID=A0A7S3LWP7_9EUKA
MISDDETELDDHLAPELFYHLSFFFKEICWCLFLFSEHFVSGANAEFLRFEDGLRVFFYFVSLCITTLALEWKGAAQASDVFDQGGVHERRIFTGLLEFLGQYCPFFV